VNDTRGAEQAIGRGAWGAVSVVLALVMLAASPAAAVERMLADLPRQSGNDRAAARHLPQSVAKAVRRLLGAGVSHGQASLASPAGVSRAGEQACLALGRIGVARPAGGGVAREMAGRGLVDLPPPSAG